MHLVYVDEVKYNPPTEQYHRLCALAFPELSLQPVDQALTDLAASYFGASVLSVQTEFHGKDILQGKGPYKGRPLDGRVTLYKSLLDLIALSGEIGRIEVRVEPARMITSTYQDKAFMFLIEKIEEYMRQTESLALVIADEDRELASTNVASLSSYRAQGTQYAFGKTITHVVDTIHHTRSHHSRLLQLADIYVYTLAMAAGNERAYPRGELVAHAQERGILFPSKYKNWPTDRSWYSSSD